MAASNKQFFKKWLQGDLFLIAFITLFYIVGIVGLSISSTKALTASLTPYHLLLTFGVAFISWKKYSLRFFVFIILTFLAGVAVEWLGVHTGYLFGNYHYGKNLGVKWDGIPLIIGVNWILMVMSSQAVVRKFTSHKWIIIIGSAAIMTLLDYAIEPVAVRLDFWSWSNGVIPAYNYICWFLVSIPMHLLYVSLKIHQPSKVVFAIFWLMAAFFILLNIL